MQEINGSFREEVVELAAFERVAEAVGRAQEGRHVYVGIRLGPMVAAA